MTHAWKQRWSDAAGTPPPETIPALWCATTPVEVNGVQQPVGARLVADAQGKWSWRVGALSRSGTTGPGSAPPTRVVLSLTELARRLSAPDGLIALDAWLTTPALLLRAEELLTEPRPLTTLRNKLGFLEEVFRQPEVRLTTETVLEVAARARRVPGRAIAHLSAHSEEWAGRSLVRVVPRRVLAEVRDDELDTYENRMVVRILDELLKLVTKRLEDVQELLKRLREDGNFSEDLVDSGHRRRHRLSMIWSEQHVDNDWLDLCTKMVTELQELKRRLLRLQGKPLYRAIPRRASMPSDVRQTNLFRDHRQYREVYALWLAWRTDRNAMDKAESEDASTLAASMDLFVAHCFAKALAQEGFALPPNFRPVKPGVSVTWTHQQSRRTLRLTAEVDGSVVLQLPATGDATLRAVGVPVVFGDSGSPDTLAQWLEESRWKSTGSEEARVLVHLECTKEELTADTSWEADWAPLVDRSALDPAAEDSWQAVPVSPWSVQSVERVARILRAWIWRSLARTYPPQMTSSGIAVVSGDALTAADGRWTVRGPQIARTSQAVADALRGANEKLLRLQDERASPQRRGGGDQKAPTTVREVNDARVRVESLERCKTELDRVTGLFDWYASCPCCGECEETLFDYAGRDKGFAATCGSCEAQWGIVPLKCGHEVPYLRTEDDLPNERAAVELLGCDVLVLPSEGTWCCPVCVRAGSSGRRG